MQSQLTVRLPDDLVNGISDVAKNLHFKRSDVVRLALEHFLEEFRAKAKEEEKPYDRVKNLIGTVSSGVSDLGEGHRKHLLRKFKKDA